MDREIEIKIHSTLKIIIDSDEGVMSLDLEEWVYDYFLSNNIEIDFANVDYEIVSIENQGSINERDIENYYGIASRKYN